MKSRPNLSEAELLEQYRVSFKNVKNQTQIATIMETFGYNETKIEEGKTLFIKTKEAYRNNQTKNDNTSAIYNNFNTLKTEIATIYKLHRKKLKIVFKNEPNITHNLGLKGQLPRIYIEWLEVVKKFYNIIITNKAIQTKIEKLQVTIEELTTVIVKIEELEELRATYLKEKGENQNATKIKHALFAALNTWMAEFYAIAKIGLIKNPQLVESLGKFVRS